MKKVLVLFSVMLVCSLSNAELIQQFKDPTFSGQGWASHVLTVEQMRQSAQNSVDSKKAAEAASTAAAAQNTPLSKFMALFTGQVYSQLATQLTNNLFKECTGDACKQGDFMVTDTQKIHWEKITGANGTTVTLQVYDGKIVDGKYVPNATPTQTITVPVSQFQF